MFDPRRRAARAPAALIAVAALLAFCAPAFALKPTVVDGADVFSAGAIAKANEVIGQIKTRFGKDLMIETYAIIPADQRAEFQRKGKESFYADWVGARGRALKADGVVMVITKDPGRLQVGVGAATRDKLFTNRDRDEARVGMAKLFGQGRFDDGLIEGVEFVLKRMERNTGAGNITAANPVPEVVRPVPPVVVPAPPPPPVTPPTPVPAPTTVAAGPATDPVASDAGHPATAPTTAATDESHGADF